VFLVAVVLLGACAGRPLGENCASGTDCAADEWCVATWRTGEVASVCAKQCSFDSECSSRCSEIGDGATLNLAPDLSYFACRE